MLLWTDCRGEDLSFSFLTCDSWYSLVTLLFSAGGGLSGAGAGLSGVGACLLTEIFSVLV